MSQDNNWLPMGDRPDHYLRPGTLYALNRIVYEVMSELQLDTNLVRVVPSAYRSQDRTWQIGCVLPSVWQSLSATRTEQDRLKDFTECCWFMTKVACDPKLGPEFDRVLASQRDKDGKLPASLQRLSEFRVAIKQIPADFLTATVAVASSSPSASREIVFSPLKFDDENLLWEQFRQDRPHVAQLAQRWHDITNGAAEHHCVLIRDVIAFIERLPLDRRSFMPGLIYRHLSGRQALSETLASAMLLEVSPGNPWLLGIQSPAFAADTTPCIHGPYHQLQLDSAVDPLQLNCDLALTAFYPTYLRRNSGLLEEKSKQVTVCLPVYSTWIHGQAFGFLRANIQGTFLEQSQDANTFRDQGAALLRRCEDVANEVTQAALARIAALPIRPPYDLVEHFVRCIVHLQDWESVAVRRQGQVRYVYRRRYANGSNDMDSPEPPTWEACLCSSSNECRCRQGEIAAANVLSWSDLGELPFWSPEFLPELSDEERIAFETVSLEFEYPRTAVVPPDAAQFKDMRRRFELALIEEQIDVMRILIPKVRARRAALRNATSAIMGRNMSHNIGSHVLARYSNRVADSTQSTVSGKADHRGEFLRYLQRRMDFIAELATTDRPMWSQPLGIRQSLQKFDYKLQCERVDGDPKDPKNNRNPILLTHISGKETEQGPVVGNVRVDGDVEWYFDCAGGEVGAHALYVILENLIRNSARHSWQELPSCITIEARVTESRKHPDYWELLLIDEHSAYRKSKKNPVAEIGRVLSHPAILDANGALDPKNWGVREMQICATYLRKLLLTDLEGRPRAPPVLQALWHKEGHKKSLAYRLYLPKARIGLFVCKVRKVVKGGAKLPSGFKVVTADEAAELAGLAPVAHGYASVILQDSLVGESLDWSAWPVRTFKKSGDEIKALLKGLLANAGDALDWADQWLHAETVTRYRLARKAWRGVDDVRSIVLWADAGDPPADYSNGAVSHTRKLEDVRSWQAQPRLPQKAIRLAWVDHLKDAELARKRIEYADASSTPETGVPVFEFVEGFRSISPHTPVLAKLSTGSAPHNELVAAALARVIVLDERVQAESGKTWGSSGLSYQQYWALSGIWVPDNGKVNLNEPVLKKIVKFLGQPGEATRQFPADFLVVHLTILEKLQRDSGLGEDAVIDRFLSTRGTGRKCEVVIVTGRGMSTVAEQASHGGGLRHRFLPISAIHEYLVGNTSKLMLMRALWSAAARPHDKEIRR